MLMMDEMNEVNDFMSHFSPNVVTKWGLSTDSSLGKKVKVTVLASGFGVNTLPGMEEKHMAEIAARTEEEDEKTEKNNIRRGKFYQSGNEPTATKHRYKTYQFSTDDLDNDNIIAMVETTPPSSARSRCLIPSRASRPDSTMPWWTTGAPTVLPHRIFLTVTSLKTYMPRSATGRNDK